MAFTFESLQKEDVDKCVELAMSTLKGQMKDYGNKDRLRVMIYGKQTVTLVGKKDGKIAGFITAALMGIPRIMFLTVSDEKTAKEGLSSQLIDKLVEKIGQILPKTKQILHNEFADSVAAIALYAFKGFRITGYIKDPVTDRDVVFMAKSI